MNQQPIRPLRLGCGEALNSSMNTEQGRGTQDQPPQTSGTDVIDSSTEVDRAEPAE